MYYRINKHKIRVTFTNINYNDVAYIHFENESFVESIQKYHRFIYDINITSNVLVFYKHNYEAFIKALEEDKDFRVIPCNSNYEYTDNIHENLKKLSYMLRQLSQQKT